MNMGRVSKRRHASADIQQPSAGSRYRRYKAGIYARLSSDMDAVKNESIDVQIRIARDFVEEFNKKNREFIDIAGCYRDIGKTGSNFNREGFLRLMQDIRLHDIDCVIVKDLSRFGRNYLEAGNYIEKIFPFLGVRFIAVADGFDTGDKGSDTGHLASEIKNLVNDMYAKDFSVKAKTGLQQRRKEGAYVGGPPPYGYLCAWEGRHRKLIPDENTAAVVKQIYELFIEKESCTAAADELNRRRVNPPAVYKKTKEVFCQHGMEYKGWTRDAVERIVKSAVYKGVLEQGKTSITAKNEKNRVHKPEKEWEVTLNAHEPLISGELYARAQDIRRNIQKITASHKHPSEGIPIGENIYEGILYCGVCGRKMTRESHVRTYADGSRDRKDGYFCMESGQGRTESCPQINRISSQNLTDIVMTVFHREFDLYLNRPGSFSETGKKQMDSVKKRIEKEIAAVCCEKDRLSEKESRAYIDYRENRMEQKDYVLFKMQKENRLQELEKQETELRKSLGGLKEVQERYFKALRSLQKLKDGSALTARLASALVEKIYVYPGKRLEIQFRYMPEMLEGVV